MRTVIIRHLRQVKEIQHGQFLNNKLGREVFVLTATLQALEQRFQSVSTQRCVLYFA